MPEKYDTIRKFIRETRERRNSRTSLKCNRTQKIGHNVSLNILENSVPVECKEFAPIGNKAPAFILENLENITHMQASFVVDIGDLTDLA